MNIIPTGETLGATVAGIDLTQPLGPADFRIILRALGEYGALRFPAQSLDAATLKSFAARFGSLEINVAGAYQEPGHPEVMILSNIVENGRPIGARDAGQDWHTDMSYSATVAFANVLYALKCRGATAGHWAAPNSPTCARPIANCRRISNAASTA